MFDRLFYAYFFLFTNENPEERTLTYTVAVYSGTQAVIVMIILLLLDITIDFFDAEIINSIVIFVPFYMFNIYYFDLSGRFKKIKSRYNDIDESEKKKLRGTAIIMIVLTVLFIIISSFF